MPLKFKLKKSRQYNVASKAVYVISVELLDNTCLECTLSAESTGRDCLENVCQRLSLQQAELFGLRYKSCKSTPQIRWVELEKPLKKQLDKYAQEYYLFMTVMFYVHDAQCLQDEITRYHYFLQLKLDLLEGKLRCNYEQAIMLAAYSLQAEFGDHDPERHTKEYLSEFTLLPKHMIADSAQHEILIDAIIQQHSNLKRLAPGLAEIYYIMESQQLENYGIEYFPAKDEFNSDVFIGTSVYGVVVRYISAGSIKQYRWGDITNLVNHKKTFGIECQVKDDTIHYSLEEHDLAKYLWKLCVMQHTFFKRYQAAYSLSDSEGEQLPLPDIQNSVLSSRVNSGDGGVQQSENEMPPDSMIPEVHTMVSEAHSRLTDVHTSVDSGLHTWTHHDSSQVTPTIVNIRGSLPSIQTFSDNASFKSMVPSYRPAPDYETALKQKYVMGSSGSVQTTQQDYESGMMQLLNMYKPPPPYNNQRLTSNSTPDLASSQLQNAEVSKSSPDLLSQPGIGFGANLNPEIHRTYENLAMLGDNDVSNGLAPSVQSLDERDSVYCVRSNHDSEPVYQNVPIYQNVIINSKDEQNKKLDQNFSSPYVNKVASSLKDETGNKANAEIFGRKTWNSPSSPESPHSQFQNIKTIQDKPQLQSDKLFGSHKKYESGMKIKDFPPGPLKVAAMNGLIGSGQIPRIAQKIQDNTVNTVADTKIGLFEAKLKDGDLLMEFEQIPKKKNNPDYSTASHPDNSNKNRFKDVLPYEENRVKLLPTKDNKIGYINASHITVTVGQNLRFYIAAQAPLLNTAQHFWQMVWEHNVQLIVMLGDTSKGHSVLYWPQEDKGKQIYGEYQIIRKFSTKSPSYVTSRLQIGNTSTKKTRQIWHLQYTDWADHGCPEDIQGFVTFLEELSMLRRNSQTETSPGRNTNFPVLVHCNAGVGRTGVTILCDILLYSLDHNLPINVPKILHHLRQQRMLMVQTITQYKLVYSVLLTYLRNSRLI